MHTIDKHENKICYLLAPFWNQKCITNIFSHKQHTVFHTKALCCITQYGNIKSHLLKLSDNNIFYEKLQELPKSSLSEQMKWFEPI